MRKTHYWIIAIVAALTGAFVWLPGYVESSMNGVLHKPPYQISTRARALQSRIPIVELQAFTVVTKTPRGLNFQRNAADSDNLTLLSIVERWPPATWSSLTERALYQASRLRDFESRSQGKFTIIRSAAGLRAYL